MTIIAEARPSDSPFIESVMHGHTLHAGSTIRPAETNWHMVVLKLDGATRVLAVGPLTSSGVVSYGAGGELLWIKFTLGTFLPHAPTRDWTDRETLLPSASRRSFWLDRATWEIPTFENVETFVQHLVRAEVLTHDPLISAAFSMEPPTIPERTLRHRFLRATGQTQSHIRQFERARQAADLLAQGETIPDVMFRLGYYDQPHLTRSLKRFIGTTPAQHIAETFAAR